MPPGATAVERRGRRAEHGCVDGAVGRLPAALRIRVDREDLVAAAAQDLREQPADEAVPDDEHAPARHALGPAEHARERLDVGAGRVVDLVRQLDALGRGHLLGEAAGDDRRLGERLAGRLVPGATALALAAGQVVQQRHASAAGAARDDLVAEHRARRRARPSFSTSEPQSPTASTRIGSEGAGTSASRGCPSPSRTTARTAAS